MEVKVEFWVDMNAEVDLFSRNIRGTVLRDNSSARTRQDEEVSR